MLLNATKRLRMSRVVVSCYLLDPVTVRERIFSTAVTSLYYPGTYLTLLLLINNNRQILIDGYCISFFENAN